MKTKIAILSAAALLFSVSCGHEHHSESSGETTKTENHDDHKAQGSDQHQNSDGIELDNGMKWKATPAMLDHLQNMQSEVKRFGETPQKSVNNYTALASSLQKKIDLVTSSCTMDGKAHEELHKWLMPYINEVDKLSKAANETEAAKIFAGIDKSLDAFNLYFE